MALMEGYGQGANLFMQNMLNQWNAGRQLYTQEQYREMQEDMIQQAIDDKQKKDEEAQALSDYISKFNTPSPTGPNPTQQRMDYFNTALQNIQNQRTPRQGTEDAGIAAAVAPGDLPPEQQAMQQADQAAQGGQFQQKYNPPLRTTPTDFLMGAMQAAPSLLGTHVVPAMATLFSKERQLPHEIQKLADRGIAGQPLTDEQKAILKQYGITEDILSPEKPAARTFEGWDPKSRQPVFTDKTKGTERLVYTDGSDYTGGQLIPKTQPGIVTVYNDQKQSAQEIYQGVKQGLIAPNAVASGRYGAAGVEVQRMAAQDGLDLTKLQINYDAKKKTQTVLTQTANQLGAFSDTAKTNLDLALSYARQYQPGSIAFLNKVRDNWNVNTGDPLIDGFKTALVAGITESMKHITAGGSIPGAELSIQAQQKGEKMINSAKSLAQLEEDIGVLKQDMVNRDNAYTRRVGRIADMSISNFTGGHPFAQQEPQIPYTQVVVGKDGLRIWKLRRGGYAKENEDGTIRYE